MTETARIDTAETVPMPSDQLPSAASGGVPASGSAPASAPGRIPGTRLGDVPPSGPDDGAVPPGGGGGGDGTPRRSFYRDAWRHVPRDFGYLAFTALLLGTVYSVFPLVILHGTAGQVLNPISLVLFLASLFVARWLGAFEQLRMSWAEPERFRPVDWTPRWRQNWFLRIVSAVANPHYWLYLLHAVVVYPLVACITIGAGATLVAGVVAPVGAGFAAITHGWQINQYLAHQGIGQTWPWVVGAIACAVSVTAAVLLFPLWTRGAVLAHYWVDRALLGGFRSEVLQQRVVGLQASRAGAVTAEGQALRQIERDLHDGPQQRLVRLRMDLAAAERAFERDPERARGLMAEASGHAKDALDELRALSRGFAPPILLDRGLVAALEALVSRTPLPVDLDVRLPDGFVLPTEIERNLYFTVSELLTNTTKHAEASSAEVSITLTSDPDGQPVLELRVRDDGRGGAAVQEGHGILGLMGRMRALDGELSVSSPAGGPTDAVARIPLGALRGTPTTMPGGPSSSTTGPVAPAAGPTAAP
ncbi:sensor histidine kinase [Curtobacterium sp. MCBD17_040]|uniref:sensor histidine kinase n=1 Tax=Curtobacterium sp. MCBD17_040 TaxID=2175674 RepID=UPI000DA79550|nr:sensor histidine kinase [Curtobacterium sp. MCBD17_040]WIB64354.1 histidine kinase [Curtobacterium sp. MCBD17_040]